MKGNGSQIISVSMQDSVTPTRNMKGYAFVLNNCQIIRTTVVKEVSLLRSMGTAVMEDRIRKKIAKIAKEQENVLIQQTGIESSLDDSEIRQYVDAVILEVKISKVPK